MRKYQVRFRGKAMRRPLWGASPLPDYDEDTGEALQPRDE